MTTIEVQGVQRIDGRKHDHVRVVGTRVGSSKLVEVNAHLVDAHYMFHFAELHGVYPTIEVDDNRWMYTLQTGRDMVVRETPNV